MVAVADFQTDRAPSYQKGAHLHTKKEAHMKRREEYRAKITSDSGLVRGRVPCPLLNEMSARPGDHLIFRLDDSGKVVVKLSRTKKKSVKRSRR
jgi:hypothetical protein